MTVTGTWIAALLLGFDWWLAFMLFGYIVIVPVVSMLFDEEDELVHVESEMPCCGSDQRAVQSVCE